MMVRYGNIGVCIAALTLVVGVGRVRPPAAAAEAFSPSVAVSVSDGSALSHPDIATTIDIASGPLLAIVRTLTPTGGGIAAPEELPGDIIVGWISGYSTIMAADGTCSNRFMFEAPLVSASPDAASFPPFLRQLAPGRHRFRMSADVAGTPVNMIVDEVEVAGEKRLQTTTYVGDPTVPPPPNCAPFRSRVIVNGMATAATPLTIAPPTDAPRVYEFELTSRPDEDGQQQIVERQVTAAVVPFAPSIEDGELRWARHPDAAEYALSGSLIYTTSCELIRRLVIRQEGVEVRERVGPEATSLALPAASDPAYELAQGYVDVVPRDSEGVMLAWATGRYDRPFAQCWYQLGKEPVMSVEPGEGSCAGRVTFAGRRFPAGVTVLITAPYYGSDGPGVEVARAQVMEDGTFNVSTLLPDGVCGIAAVFREGRMVFFAFNADEPPAMTIFARAEYVAIDAVATSRAAALPQTGRPGGGLKQSAPHAAALLLALGLATATAGALLRRADDRR